MSITQSATGSGGGGGGSTDPTAPNAVELSDGAAYYVAAKDTTLQAVLTTADFDTKTGSLTETAPASDTASSGLNGRLQRIAQRLTSLIALLPSALVGGLFNVNIGGQSGSVSVAGTVTSNQGTAASAAGSWPVEVTDGSNTLATAAHPLRTDPTGTTPQPITASSLPLPATAATDATVAGVTTAVNTLTTQSDFDTKVGSLTETAPATDTASSGLNGRLQRVAQRLTSLIALLPAALVGGRLDVNLGATPGKVSTANSSTTPLAGNAAFTGTSEDVSGIATINVSIVTDQASAAGGLSAQFSSDGSNWDLKDTQTIPITLGMAVFFKPRAQFFRLVYTNGTTLQGTFRLQTVHHTLPVNVGGEANREHDTGGAGLLGIGPLYKSVSHGSTPAAVTTIGNWAQRLCNAIGIPFVMAGHPNIQTFAVQYTTAQTNTAVVGNSAGTKFVVTKLSVKTANANTADVSCRVGFGATVPAYGSAQLLGTSPGIAPGSGFTEGNGAGMLGVGADGDPISITCGAPTGGAVDVLVTYYPVSS